MHTGRTIRHVRDVTDMHMQDPNLHQGAYMCNTCDETLLAGRVELVQHADDHAARRHLVDMNGYGFHEANTAQSQTNVDRVVRLHILCTYEL
jgi:hypothetical protein